MLLSFFILIGCTSNSKYKVSPEWDKSKLGKVNLYNANSSIFSKSLERPFVYMDDIFIGHLGEDQKLSVEVIPGKHVFTVKESIFFMPIFESGLIKIDVIQKEKYYIRYFEDYSIIDWLKFYSYQEKEINNLKLVDKSDFENKK